MCLICGRALLAHATIAVNRDGLGVHRGTCHRHWMLASGFERLRLIDRHRLPTHRGSFDGWDRRAT
jgi:hypothetical protein